MITPSDTATLISGFSVWNVRTPSISSPSASCFSLLRQPPVTSIMPYGNPDCKLGVGTHVQASPHISPVLCWRPLAGVPRAFGRLRSVQKGGRWESTARNCGWLVERAVLPEFVRHGCRWSAGLRLAKAPPPLTYPHRQQTLAVGGASGGLFYALGCLVLLRHNRTNTS